MQFIHDIHVNWVDGGSRKHDIPEYFEWRNGDHPELMDTLPLLVVKPELFSMLEDGYVDIPKDILAGVHRLAARINPDTKRKNKVEYAFAMTDKKRVLVINTENDTKPNLKSRMIPRQELFVLEIVAFTPFEDYPLPEPEEYGDEDETLEDKILNMKPEYVLGLTRAEKEMKAIIMDCLFNVACSENPAEVAYWYVEVFPTAYEKVNKFNFSNEEMVTEIFDFIKDGWSDRHEEFGTALMKVYDIFAEEWDRLIKLGKRRDEVVK